MVTSVLLLHYQMTRDRIFCIAIFSIQQPLCCAARVIIIEKLKTILFTTIFKILCDCCSDLSVSINLICMLISLELHIDLFLQIDSFIVFVCVKYWQERSKINFSPVQPRAGETVDSLV